MNEADICEARGYEFANRIWLARVFGKKRLYAHLRIVAFSLFPVVAGGVLAYVFGFLRQFATNWAIYYGAFGVYLTTAAVWHGNKTQYEIYDRFLDCFNLTEEERQKILRETLESYSDTWRQARSILSVFFVALAIATIAFWSQEIDSKMGNWAIADLFRFEDFRTAGWYDSGDRPLAFSLTLLFAAWGSVALGTAYRLMLRMPRILLRCAKNGTSLFPRLVKMHFEPLAGFYTRISLLWGLGTLLFLILFRHNDNWFFWISSAFLAVLGAFNFFIPQIVYLGVANKAERFWLIEAQHELRRSLSATGTVTTLQAGTVPLLFVDSYYFTHERFVYPIHEAYGVLFAQIIPFVLPLLPQVRILG